MFNHKTADLRLYGILKRFAKENREHPTLAESMLWEVVREKRLGCKFLRQHIIDEYIVDFVCQENGLVIEVDGGYHAERLQQEDDALRTERLEAMGFRVIRFTNEEVLYDTDYVTETINKIINR